jgi:Tol biopolymer transport system component
VFGQESGLAGGVVAIDGTQKTVVTEEEHGFLPFALGWTAGGEAVYYTMSPDQGGHIVRVPFDPTEGTFVGDPTAVYNLGVTAASTSFVSGETLVYVGGSMSGNIMGIDLAGAPEVTDHPTSMLTRGTANNTDPALTPDGDTVLFARITTWGEGWDLLLRPTAGGAERLITHRPGYGLATMPAMSSDGRHLAFYELNEELQTGLVVLTIATGHATEFPVARNQHWAVWSPDGQRILTSGLGGELTLVSPRDSSETILEIECDTTCPDFWGSPVYSPDGNRITLAGDDGLWIVTLRDGHGSRVVNDAKLLPLIWTEDGLFFSGEETAPSGDRHPSIYRIALEDGDPQLYARIPKECQASEFFAVQLTLSHDASMAVCTVVDSPWDVHIVENFDRTGSR